MRTRRCVVAGAVGIASLLPAPVAAQWAVGAKVGLNSTTIASTRTPLGGGPEGVRRRSSLSGGIVLAVGVDAPVGLRLEALLSGKGFEERESDGDRVVLDVDYLELPLLAEWSAWRAGPVRAALYAGPWLAVEVGCEATARGNGGTLRADCDDVPGGPILRHTTDWGVAGGVAASLSFGTSLEGLVDLRYSAGLRNVDAAPRIDNADVRHRGIGISAGLLLPLGP